MITDKKYFDPGLEKINKEITSYNKNVELLFKRSINNFSKKEITRQFNNIFKVFPYEVESASNYVGISVYTRELFDLFYKISDYDGKIDDSDIDSAKLKLKTPLIEKNDKYFINDFFEDFFHTLTYWYRDILKNTMDYHFFFGIKEERVILMNLLNLYKNILANKSKQLCFFWGVTLTKTISDIATKMLIDFIEQRLIVLNPELDLEGVQNKMTFIDNKHKPIEWFGSQQELCELFLELIDKKWIPEIGEGERKKIASSIGKLFDLSHTKRNNKSNPQESFYQQLKGELMDGKRYYRFLESKKYERKFDTIRKNKAIINPDHIT